MVYQIGHLIAFSPDDPTFTEEAAAVEAAETLSDAQNIPVGVWDMTGGNGDLLAIVYEDAVYRP